MDDPAPRRKRAVLLPLAVVLAVGVVLREVLARSIADRNGWGFLALATPPLALAALAGALALVAALRRNWVAFVLCAIVAVVLPLAHWDWSPGEPIDGEPDLRVLTLNAARATRGVDKLVALIRAEDPDVVCLQDADAYFEMGVLPPELARRLPEYEVRTYWQMVILSKLPVLDDRWTLMPGGEHRRTAFEVTVQTRRGPLRVVTTHWPRLSPRQVFLQPWTAPAHADDVTAKQHAWAGELVRLVTEGDTPTILCGDFNRPPEGEVHALLDTVMDDAWQQVGGGYGYTFPAWAPVLRLDAIWTGPGVQPLRIHRVNGEASDHLGLVAELKLVSSRARAPD